MDQKSVYDSFRYWQSPKTSLNSFILAGGSVSYVDYEWGPWSSCNPDGYRARSELCEDTICAVEYEACVYYGKLYTYKNSIYKKRASIVFQSLGGPEISSLALALKRNCTEALIKFSVFQSPIGVLGHPAQIFVEMATRHDFGTAKAIHFAAHF